MMKEDSYKYSNGWGNYKKFKKEFNKYEWDLDNTFTDSLFNYSQGGYLHASIYRFDNKGMIMIDPISYLLSVIYINKYIRKHRIKIVKIKKEIIKW